MATRTIGAKVALEGEREFKQAISNINSGLSTLNSEMRKTTAEYQDNADSVEALTQKGDVLERTLLTQKEKVEELRKALANAKEQYGEADSRTMKWEKSLNEAETAVYNTEAAIKKNNEALEQAQSDTNILSEGGMKSLIDQFKDLLPSSVSNALDAIEGFSSGSVSKIALVTAAVTAVIEAYKQLIEITQEAASKADDIATLATTSGIDKYTLQVLDYMEDLADIDLSTVTGSMKKLISSMESAKEGSEDTQAAFAELGISITDSEGNLRDSTEVFWEAIDALGNIQNSTERDATAMEIFGKSAQDLNTLIGIGTEGFKEYAQEAENAGYILSDKELSVLNEYNDALDRANKKQEAMTDQMAVKMAPALTDLTECWNQLCVEGLDLLMDSGIIDFLAELIELLNFVIKCVDGIVEILDAAFEILDGFLGEIGTLFGFYNEQLETNVELTNQSAQGISAQTAAMNQQKTTIESVKSAMDALTESQVAYLKSVGIYASNIGTIDGTYVQAIKGKDGTTNYYNVDTTDYSWADSLDWDGVDNIDMRTKKNASGNQNFEGGWTLVGESGAELAYLPQGSMIYNNQDSRDIGGDNFYFTIDASSVKELNDLVRIAQNSRMSVRMRG